jgi:tetratricopeptide (TPR) repeat protein
MDEQREATSPVTVFYSYARQDEELREELEKHLSALRRQGLITEWYDRQVLPGTDQKHEIDIHLVSASVVLLLVSPDFIASDYCYSDQVQRAMERHAAGEARVIPVLLRPVDYRGAPFTHLQCLPRGAKPVTTWRNRDEAFVDIANGIRTAIENLYPSSERGIHHSGSASSRVSISKKQTLPREKKLGTAVANLALTTSSSHIWNVPYQRNPLFTGREALLQKLFLQFIQSQTLASVCVQALSGLRGIGKTQIAVEYAYRCREKYQAILWVRADVYEILVSDFVALADVLDLYRKDEHDQKLLIKLVKRWLQSNKGWLLIFDNVEDLELVSDFFPTDGEGHILLTTYVQATGMIASRIEVGKMTLEEGASFLLKRAKIDNPSATDRIQALKISQEMDGLPLALDQAGAFIEEAGCSLIDYLNLYQTERTAFLKQRGELNSGHPESVAITFSLSFEKVKKANFIASELLCFCAFLHAEGIPEEIFTEAASFLGPVLSSIATRPLELSKAIAELRKYSLVYRNSETRTLSMHRLVQTVLKDGMTEEERRQWAESVVFTINKVFPKPEFKTWSSCHRYFPHAQACTMLIGQWNIDLMEAANLLYRVGHYLQECARYEEAEPLYRRALAIDKKQFGAEHPYIATTLNNLALLYTAQGRYEEAEPLYREVLTIDEKTLGKEHPHVAAVLNNLADFYLYLHKYEEAKPLYLRAHTIAEKTLGKEHHYTATIMSNLASLYHAQGNYNEAEKLYLQALAIDERVLGPQHPEVATDCNNLGECYHARARFPEAEQLYLRALQIYEHVLGKEHPHVVACLNNLMECYDTQDKKAEAEQIYERIMEIYEKERVRKREIY